MQTLFPSVEAKAMPVESVEPGTRARGRPRDDELTWAVQAEALRLAYEGGVTNVTVDKLVTATGVAKSSIYRRWGHAAAVVMDAFLADVEPEIRFRRRKDIRASFKSWMKALLAVFAGRRGALLAHLLGEAQHDPALQEAFVSRWIAPRRDASRTVLARAVAEGELPAQLDVELLIDALYGPLYYRLVVSFQPFEPDYVDRLVDQVFDGFASGHQGIACP